jgi:ATP-dependent DNA helicase RecQ
LLSFLTQQEILGVLDELHRQSLVEQSDVDRYRPILQLTPLGGEVMRGKAALPLPISLCPGTVLKVQRTWGGATAATVVQRTATAGDSEQQPDPRLLQRLRQWRREQAEQAECPTYRIVPSSVLEHLASAPYETVDELLGVRGIGPATVERFGEELLELLRNYREEANAGHSVLDAAVSPVNSHRRHLVAGKSLAGTLAGDLPGQAASGVWADGAGMDHRDLLKQPAQAGSRAQPAGETEEEGEDGADRPYYWTWRVLAAGFRPRECAAIRRCSLDDVYREAVSAYEHGLDIEPSWLFTREELTALEKLADRSTEGVEDSQAREVFSAAQWEAFRVCCRP